MFFFCILYFVTLIRSLGCNKMMNTFENLWRPLNTLENLWISLNTSWKPLNTFEYLWIPLENLWIPLEYLWIPPKSLNTFENPWRCHVIILSPIDEAGYKLDGRLDINKQNESTINENSEKDSTLWNRDKVKRKRTLSTFDEHSLKHQNKFYKV